MCYVVQPGELPGNQACAYGVLHYYFFSHGFIDMIMVGADVRRQGYGVALVRHFQQLCTTSRLFGSTNASNQTMQKLLCGAGFRSSCYIDNPDERADIADKVTLKISFFVFEIML